MITLPSYDVEDSSNAAKRHHGGYSIIRICLRGRWGAATNKFRTFRGGVIPVNSYLTWPIEVKTIGEILPSIIAGCTLQGGNRSI